MLSNLVSVIPNKSYNDSKILLAQKFDVDHTDLRWLTLSFDVNQYGSSILFVS